MPRWAEKYGQTGKNGAGQAQKLKEGSLAGQMETGTGGSRLPGQVGPGLIDAVDCLPIALGEGGVELDVSRDPLQAGQRTYVKTFSLHSLLKLIYSVLLLIEGSTHRGLAVCGWMS